MPNGMALLEMAASNAQDLAHSPAVLQGAATPGANAATLQHSTGCATAAELGIRCRRLIRTSARSSANGPTSSDLGLHANIAIEWDIIGCRGDCRASCDAPTVTPRKIEANRRNAQRSTGPLTHRGKRNSKFNAVTLGLFAKHVAIPICDGYKPERDFQALLDNLHQDFRPAGVYEEWLVVKIAECMWRLRRATRCETGSVREAAIWDRPQLRPAALLAEFAVDSRCEGHDPSAEVARRSSGVDAVHEVKNVAVGTQNFLRLTSGDPSYWSNWYKAGIRTVTGIGPN
jgi:hypothetical protein